MKNIKKHSLAALLGLALILCFGGCENPANDDTDNTENTTAAAQKAADDFYTAHLEILEKPADMLTLDDEALVTAALKSYVGLKAEARGLLAPEKARLDILKAGVDRLKIWAEQGEYYTAADLAAYLAGQPDKGAAEPYAVAYTGNETMVTIYKALEAGGKYVNLNLSASGVTGITGGDEEGRAYIVSLMLPDSLTETPDGTSTAYIFHGFENLTTFRAAGLTRLGGYTFTARTKLTTVDLPLATDIGSEAFKGCSSLTRVNLPEAVSIGRMAFNNCGSLGSIILPKAEAIGDYAFQTCSSLTGWSLPKVKTIGISAFKDCVTLTQVLTTMNALPEAVSIGASAFQDCDNLTTVILPNAVTIGNPLSGSSSTFSGCGSLTTVSLPNAETILGSAFVNCTGLATITLPKAVSIGNTVFNGCSSLTTVTLPNVASIGNSAFQACASLTEVILGYMPPTIGTTIFRNASTDSSRTITFKTPVSTFYTMSPWSDKLNGSEGTYWDNSATSANLTVALDPPIVP
jgi:hypothetical protein